MVIRRIARPLLDRLLRLAKLQRIDDRPMRDMTELTLLKMRERAVATLLDVGANVGQFAQGIRGRGYRGRIVSFEPLSEAHAGLAAAAADDADWIVAERMALGARDGEARINISGESPSSSLLPLAARTAAVAAYVGSERVKLRRLDRAMRPEWPGPYAIKIDTQGFELEVLRGAPETLAQTELLTVELSLARIYTGGARMAEIFDFLEDAGFRAIALLEGYSDLAHNEMLEVDGVFVRDRPNA